MQTEIPVQSIAAMATIVAALIAGGLSFVNLTLTKEQKVSEFRQAWIDGLRNDLAAFFSAARAFARAIDALNRHGSISEDQAKVPFSDEKIGELRHTAAEAFYRIKLRLNPEEAEHKELQRLLERAIEEQNAVVASEGADERDVLKAIDRASDFARPVLKTEWNRVKKGELPFRIARNWLAPAIVLLSIAFVVFIWLGKFKI